MCGRLRASSLSHCAARPSSLLLLTPVRYRWCADRTLTRPHSSRRLTTRPTWNSGSCLMQVSGGRLASNGSGGPIGAGEGGCGGSCHAIVGVRAWRLDSPLASVCLTCPYSQPKHSPPTHTQPTADRILHLHLCAPCGPASRKAGYTQRCVANSPFS